MGALALETCYSVPAYSTTLPHFLHTSLSIGNCHNRQIGYAKADTGQFYLNIEVTSFTDDIPQLKSTTAARWRVAAQKWLAIS